MTIIIALQWRHYEPGGVSNHQRLDCLLNRLFSAVQRKDQNSAPLAFVSEFTGDRWIPRTGPVTRKMFPFDDVIIENNDDIWKW